MIDPGILDRGEKLLWSGKPDPIGYAYTKSWPTFLFGVVFFGFAVFWTYNVSNQSGMSSALFGVPFLMIGAALLLSPLWNYFRGTAAVYALTDRRAIVDIRSISPKRTSYPLDKIQFVDLQQAYGVG